MHDNCRDIDTKEPENVILCNCTFLDACKYLADSYGSESYVDCIAGDERLHILLSIGSFDYNEREKCLIALHSAV